MLRQTSQAAFAASIFSSWFPILPFLNCFSKYFSRCNSALDWFCLLLPIAMAVTVGLPPLRVNNIGYCDCPEQLWPTKCGYTPIFLIQCALWWLEYSNKMSVGQGYLLCSSALFYPRPRTQLYRWYKKIISTLVMMARLWLRPLAINIPAHIMRISRRRQRGVTAEACTQIFLLAHSGAVFKLSHYSSFHRHE